VRRNARQEIEKKIAIDATKIVIVTETETDVTRVVKDTIVVVTEKERGIPAIPNQNRVNVIQVEIEKVITGIRIVNVISKAIATMLNLHHRVVVALDLEIESVLTRMEKRTTAIAVVRKVE
jgi:hypothetical protein